MTIYISQGRYTDQAIKGMLQKPEDRTEPVRKLIEVAGGKMVSLYVTLGEYDFFIVSEWPGPVDATGVLSALIVAAAGGGVTGLKTTLAMTGSEAQEAMRKAGKIAAAFRSAGT